MGELQQDLLYDQLTKMCVPALNIFCEVNMHKALTDYLS